MNKRTFILAILFLMLCVRSFSQDFSFGRITVTDFANAENKKENAIVLHEFGKAAIEYNANKGELVLRSYYHTKIQIITKDGQEQANFTIPLYQNGSNKEFIEGIKGATYNLQDGKVVVTELPKKQILVEKSSDQVNLTKIAFPDVREGSIIELRYSVESPFLYNLQSWSFQSTIPKLHSEFVTDIPTICRYNVNLRGGSALTSHKTEAYDTKIKTSTGNVDGIRTIYIRKDIPAFVEEDYMTTSKNFISKLTFELASFSIPFGPSHNFTRTWDDVDKSLRSSDNFGKELKRKNIFKPILPTLLNDEMTDYDKANALYDYVRSQIKWNKKNGLFAENGVKKALESKSGNVADINIALICALQEAGLEATPVILSTRANGYPSFTHPALTDFNYVIANLKIGEEHYLLDAADEYTSFGLIPHHCINLQGRHLQENASNWIDLAANQPSHTSYLLQGKLQKDGSFVGSLQISYSGYAANNKRKEIKGFNSTEEYLEDLEEKTTQFTIKESNISHLDNTKFNLVQQLKINIPNFAHQRNKKITFNPLILGRTTKNPFNLDERTYPVDLGSSIETSYEILIELPEGYNYAQNFKNINMALPNRDARYRHFVKEDGGNISIQISSSIAKPLFMPEEYLDLKEFFSRIIQSQKIDLELQQI